MWQKSSKPCRVGDHVGIQSGNVLCWTTWKSFDKVVAVVQIACFEVMVLAFRSGRVIEVVSFLPETVDRRADFGGTGIIQDYHTETVRRVIGCACGFCRVQDSINVFAGAGDEHIHSRRLLLLQAKLLGFRATSLKGKTSQNMIEQSRSCRISLS